MSGLNKFENNRNITKRNVLLASDSLKLETHSAHIFMTNTWKPINNQKEAYDCVIVFVNNECPKTSKPKRGHSKCWVFWFFKKG